MFWLPASKSRIVHTFFVKNHCMNIFKKILLYLSAFVPLYVLLLVKISIQIANGNLHTNVLNTIMLSLLCALVGLGTLGVFFAFSGSKATKIDIISCKNITEKHFLGYFSLFVLFALTFEIEYIAMAVVFVLILVMVGVVYIKNNLFYINPLLNIVGFSFYQVEYKISSAQKTEQAIFISFGKLLPSQKYSATISPANFNIVRK